MRPFIYLVGYAVAYLFIQQIWGKDSETALI